MAESSYTVRVRMVRVVCLGRVLWILKSEVGESGTVVEAAFGLVGKVAQSIPLRARLRVERPDIVVDASRSFVVDVLVESMKFMSDGWSSNQRVYAYLTPEENNVVLCVERPVEADSLQGISAEFYPDID